MKKIHFIFINNDNDNLLFFHVFVHKIHQSKKFISIKEFIILDYHIYIGMYNNKTYCIIYYMMEVHCIINLLY